MVTTDVLCPAARKIFETFLLPSLMPCFFSLSKDEASHVTKAPKGQWVWLPVLSLTSGALIVLGSASSTEGSSGSSGCKCFPEASTPRNSPSSSLPSGAWLAPPHPSTLGSTTFRLLSLLLWELTAACPLHPLSQLQITHSFSVVGLSMSIFHTGYQPLEDRNQVILVCCCVPWFLAQSQAYSRCSKSMFKILLNKKLLNKYRGILRIRTIKVMEWG